MSTDVQVWIKVLDLYDQPPSEDEDEALGRWLCTELTSQGIHVSVAYLNDWFPPTWTRLA